MRPPEIFRGLAAQACVALLLLGGAPAGLAQRRRQPAPKPRPRPSAPARTGAQSPAAATPATPAPTRAEAPRRAEPDVSFEELLVADGYTVYAEVRRVGALSQTEEVKSAVATLTLLGGAEAKPLTDAYTFVSGSAEALGESRLVFAFLPARQGLPQGLLAVELESAAAAAAFEPKFRRMLGEQVRPLKEAIDPQPAPTGAKARPPQPAGRQKGVESKPAADFAVRRAGRWLIAADAPFTLKRLRGEEGEMRLADSPRFQSVRGRFPNDSLFVYVDTDVAQKGWALQVQRAAEARLPEETGGTLTVQSADTARIDAGVAGGTASPSKTSPGATQAPAPTPTGVPETPREPDVEESVPEPAVEEVRAPEEVPALAMTPADEEAAKVPPPAPTEQELAVRGMGGVMRSIWGGFPRIPGAVALGARIERGALAVRVAVENTTDGTVALIPFLPNIISGPPVTAEAASVAPADSELFVAGSLDWTHVYNSTLGAAAVNAPQMIGSFEDVDGRDEMGGGLSADQSVAAVEKLFGFKFREDLLPALGNEVAFSMPLEARDFGFGPRGSAGAKGEKDEKEEPDAEPGPLYIASLNNAGKIREILPRVLVALGFVQPGTTDRPLEKRAGHEIRAAGLFSYTIINNFLVLGEPKAVRHCVDSFESRRTLAASDAYVDATGWQAKQKLAHLFVSDAVLRGVVDETKKRSAASTDPAVRALLSQLETAEYAPATYEATNEGDVLIHELRLPLSLVRSYAMAVTVIAKDAPVLGNESMALYTLQRIAASELAYKDDRKKGRFGTLEELFAEELLEKNFVESMGYRFELRAGSDKFEATATPKEYGKTGRRSFFVDESGTTRAADRRGEPATSADPPVDQ
jgi:hypothetical protein